MTEIFTFPGRLLSLVILLFNIFGLNALHGQEILVRFQKEVVLQAPAGQQKALANNPQIQHILNQIPPKQLLKRFSTSNKAPLGNVYLLEYQKKNDSRQALSEFKKLSSVVYATENHRYRLFSDPDDPEFNQQWYLNNINAPAAWEIERGEATTVVGVIDTGIDYLHEDLQGQLWINSAEDLNRNGRRDSLDFNGIDDDQNGYVDDVVGWDFTDAPNFPDQGDFRTPDNDPMDEFSTGHGTAAAGIIAAAQNNALGISGVAPGVRVMALRAGTASGFLEEDDVAEAILYAVDNGCKVVNMSFGDVVFSYLLRDAIEYGRRNGVIFVASSGNSGTATPNYPAAFDNTISVGASTRQDQLASFSSYGDKLNIVAPGQDIYSTQIDNRYGPTNGTSFSAPIVSAALALILSHHPNYSPEQATGALYAGARDAGFNGWDTFFGHGIVDVLASLQAAEQGYAEIISPATASGVAADTVAIIGTVFSPNIREFTLAYGVGEQPFSWTVIRQEDGRQVIGDTLAYWLTAGLPDTTYTLELRVRRNAYQDLVVRNTVILDHSPPQLSELDTIAVTSGVQNGAIIRFRSDDPAIATLRFRAAGSETFNISRSSRYFQTEHHFVLRQQELPPRSEFYVELRNGAGSRTIADNNGQFYPLNLSRVNPIENIFSELEILDFNGFFMPLTADFNQNGTPEFVISELINNEQFGPLKIIEFQNQLPQIRLQTEFPLIPRDAGVLGEAGGIALLCGFGSNSVLLGGNPAGSFPAGVAWDDTTNFWASRLLDYDGDGQLELFARQFGVWKIFDVSGQYQLQEQQALPDTTAGSNQFGVPWTVLADLDGDSLPEIIYDDLDGDLYRFEYGPSGYRFVNAEKLPGRGGDGMIWAADLTGDGRQELVTVVRNEPEILLESNVNTRYWAMTIWKSQANDQLAAIWQNNFLGATVQTGIHNGLSCADVDGDGRAEILFSPFPRAYLIEWDGADFVLRWYREGINSNAPLAADFDNNGSTEVLINGSSGIIRLEIADLMNRPPAPAGLVAAPGDTHIVNLNWQQQPAARQFNIYRRRDGEAFSKIDSTTIPEYQDLAVQQGLRYTYAVTAVFPELPEPESPQSNLAAATPGQRPFLLEHNISGNRQIWLNFSEPMSDAIYQTANYHLLANGEQPASVIRSNNRNNVLLSFLNEFNAGENRLSMSGLFDADGTPFQQDTLVITFDYRPPNDAFYIERIKFVSKSILEVFFDRAVNPVAAGNTANYQLTPDGNVLAATVDAENKSLVRLTVDPQNRMGSLGVAYYLAAENIIALDGTLLDSNGGNRLLIQAKIETLDNLIVYPNPYVVAEAGEPCRFANLPDNTEIFIYNPAGQLVRQLSEDVRGGAVEWDLLTVGGKAVASGVYLFVARHKDIEKKGKFVIVR